MSTYIIKTAPDQKPARCMPSRPSVLCVTCARKTLVERLDKNGERREVMLDVSTLPARLEGCPLYVP